MIYVQNLFERLNPKNWGDSFRVHHLKQIVKIQQDELGKLRTELDKRLPEHTQIGQGIFLYEDYELEPLKSKYAIKQVKKDPSKKKYFQILEKEATTEVTSAVHGMCRQSLFKNKDFVRVRKELS